MTLTKAERRIKTALAVFIDMKHPVALAVEPLRVEAIARAEKNATKIVANVRKELKEAGGDLEKCTPYPRKGFSMPEHEWRAAHAKYNLFSTLCRSDGACTYRPGDPRPGKIDPTYVTKYIDQHKKDAANDYDAFVVKLCQKIGDCSTATITGDHVWSKSFLTVEGVGVQAEVWMTQQIVNVSKLGRYFNQWPSRKLKT